MDFACHLGAIMQLAALVLEVSEQRVLNTNAGGTFLIYQCQKSLKTFFPLHDYMLLCLGLSQKISVKYFSFCDTFLTACTFIHMWLFCCNYRMFLFCCCFVIPCFTFILLHSKPYSRKPCSNLII